MKYIMKNFKKGIGYIILGSIIPLVFALLGVLQGYNFWIGFLEGMIVESIILIIIGLFLGALLLIE